MLNGNPPFVPSDIVPSFGSGGKNLAPNQGVPSVPAILKDLLSRVSAAVATTAGLTNSLAADRVDGMLVLSLDTYTLWVWKAADSTAADAKHIKPTDVGAGNGRWVDFVDASSGGTGLADTVQAGTTTLVAGVSPAIAATVTANTRIVALMKTAVPGAGNLTINFAALGTDRVVGAPGSFKISATKADGTVNTVDLSTLDWIAIN